MNTILQTLIHSARVEESSSWAARPASEIRAAVQELSVVQPLLRCFCFRCVKAFYALDIRMLPATTVREDSTATILVILNYYMLYAASIQSPAGRTLLHFPLDQENTFIKHILEVNPDEKYSLYSL